MILTAEFRWQKKESISLKLYQQTKDNMKSSQSKMLYIRDILSSYDNDFQLDKRSALLKYNDIKSLQIKTK